MEVHRGSEDVASPILGLSTRYRQAVSLALAAVPLGTEPLVPTEQEDARAPEPVSTFWRTEISFTLDRDGNNIGIKKGSW
jgi:hypothetical protein